MGYESIEVLSMSDMKKVFRIFQYFIPFFLSIPFVTVPIEDFLSEYPFFRIFPWYYCWRGAFVSLLMWLTIGAIYSLNESISDRFLWGSLASFLIYHYLSLVVISTQGYSVVLYPLFYTISTQIHGTQSTFQTLYVDTGQLLLLLTILFSDRSRNKIRNLIIKSKNSR